MPKPERQQNVLDLLKGLRGIEPLKKLFWSELNYQRINEPLSRRGWTETASKSLADDPILFAGGGENNDFHVIYCRLASGDLSRAFERPVVTQLLREHPYALFVFSNHGQTDWHFLNVKLDEKADHRRLFRRITVRPGAGLRTATERVQLLNLAEIHPEFLSAEYDDAKFKRVPVRGLIHIFNRYNFTIEENTPIEQEVALDPELSGKVFENLLAAYNPETGATARKQTGSFYTPREIVNYMVDEALIACLKEKLTADCADNADGGPRSVVADSPNADATERVHPNVEPRLRHLFAYNDEPHQFTPREVDALIAAIDSLKSLDPAVGSGAFPMGILHKLVFILGKLSQQGVCENTCATSDGYKLQEFIQEESKTSSQSECLRIINTGTIGKYVSKWGQREMVYLGQRHLKPVVNKKRFLGVFQNSYGKKSVKPKLVVKGLNLLDACLDLDGTIIPGKTTLMITSEKVEALKFLLGVINSRVAFFYLKEKYPASSYNQGTTFTKEMINDLPLPKMTAKGGYRVTSLVDRILAAKRQNPAADTSGLERQIDQQVYALYGLTPEEIKIVESASVPRGGTTADKEAG